MSMQPSASKTALIIACPRPFDPELETAPDEPEEPARYGSAFHQILAACLRGPQGSSKNSTKDLLEKQAAAYAREVDRAAKAFDVEEAAQELAGHVKSSVGVFRNWLKREKLEVVAIETAYGITPHSDGAWSFRDIGSHDADHHYDVEDGEVPGTVDVIAATENRRRVVVIDHKTGLDAEWYGGEEFVFARPIKIAQMRTLGLCGASVAATRQRSAVELGVFHADRRGLPAIYTDPYEPHDMRVHVVALHAALQLIGTKFLRSGAHCSHCPIKTACPMYTADLLAEGVADLVRAATVFGLEPVNPKALHVIQDDTTSDVVPVEERAGVLYDLLKRFKALEELGREEIKRLVRAGSIIETKEGKTLAIRTQTYETLSKKSVVEALGKVEGEKELERLRKKGAVREATREMLVAEK